MTPNRPRTTEHISNEDTYYRRAPARVLPRSKIEGVSERRPGYVPSSQYEYLDSLSAAPPKLSRFYKQQQSSQSTNSGFGLKVNLLLNSAAPRIKHAKPYLPVIGIALLLLTSIVGLGSMRSAEHVEANRTNGRASIETMIDTDNEITERRPTSIQNYKVADDLPRILDISNMGLSARVRRVGVGTDSELKMPSNIHDVGWYESSVKPGENGAVVLTGHAIGPTKPGIFHDLTELKPGDEFELETGAGDRYTYYIAKLEAFRDNALLAPMLAPAIPGVPGLNLITETGKYDPTTNTFDQRLVVYAVQKSVTKNNVTKNTDKLD